MVNDITESGMVFVSDNVFPIENTTLYKNISRGNGVKTVEFVRAIEDKLLFVEAKTTFPNPNNPSEENPKRFQSEIKDICDKFIHSLNLFSSVKVGVAECAFPDDFVLPEKVSFVFILVVKTHESKWCIPVAKALTETLPSYLKKIWKPTVLVINHNSATKMNITI